MGGALTVYDRLPGEVEAGSLHELIADCASLPTAVSGRHRPPLTHRPAAAPAVTISDRAVRLADRALPD